MPDDSTRQPLFVKVAECLYRNSSSGTYFALVKRKGKQIRKSLKTDDRKLAERRLREFRQDAERLTASSRDRKTPFQVLAARWLDIHNGHLKASSADRNRRNVKELNKFFGDRPIADITARDCEDWAKRRIAETAPSTFNKDISVLKAILDYAKRDGLILDNPALVIRRRKITNRELIIPTRDEYRRLIQALETLDPRAHQSANLVQLLALSGMRLGEATAIIWREVDFQRDQFTVSGGTTGTKNREIRTVPLFPNLRCFLEDHHKQAKPNTLDRIIPIDSTKTALTTAAKLANTPRFTHHSFRHYFVSNAIEVGIDFKTIAAWVGHKDGGILVAKTYGHLRHQHSDEMAKLMMT